MFDKLRPSEVVPLVFGIYLLASTCYVVGYFRVIGYAFMQGITFADFLSFSWTGVPAFLIGLFPVAFLNILNLQRPPTWEYIVDNFKNYTMIDKVGSSIVIVLELSSGLLIPAFLSTEDYSKYSKSTIHTWRWLS